MEELFDRIVNETVLSGIEPISVDYTAVYDGYSERHSAYRGEISLFTADAGVTGQKQVEALDEKDLGAKLFKRALRKVLRLSEDVKELEYPPAFLSIKAPIALLFEENLYETLTAVLAEEVIKEPEKICLEFSVSILKGDREIVKRGLKDVKAAGFTIAINGFGEEEFPTAALFDVKPDIIYLSPKMTALLTDRADSGAAMNLIVFVRSVGIEVIAEGVTNDDEIRQLQKAECLGVIPKEGYEGEFNFEFKTYKAEDVLGAGGGDLL